tara:strand:+ start:1654 stop:2076 length:423 start_codon:yes stop_codon:yes gene_type:complete
MNDSSIDFEFEKEIIFMDDFSSLNGWNNTGWSIGSSRALPNPPYAIFYNSGARGDENGSLRRNIDLSGAKELSFLFNGDLSSLKISINGIIVTNYEPYISSSLIKIRLTGLEISDNSTVLIEANPREYYQISLDDIKFSK